MTWHTHEGIRFWVGMHPRLGLLVFSEEALGASLQELEGYSALRREVVTFKKDVLRTSIQSTGFTDEEALAAIESSLRPVPRSAASTRARVARCWSCHAPLSGASDKSCKDCGWIFCRCGACGCNRPA